MMKQNSLKGEAISAWIDNHRTSQTHKVFRFFADDLLHEQLLLRRNGPLGDNQEWNIFLYVGAQHTKVHISQKLGVATSAVAEAAQLKEERERVAAEEADRAEAEAKAKSAANNNKAKATSAETHAKIQGYFVDKQLRAAAIVAEEEAAEAERLLNEGGDEPKEMNVTNNAKPTSSWAADTNDDKPLTTSPSQTPKK
jgi:hypothetical protein